MAFNGGGKRRFRRGSDRHYLCHNRFDPSIAENFIDAQRQRHQLGADGARIAPPA